MRKLMVIAAMACLIAGCKSAIGPRQSRALPPADDPLLSIEEQRRQARFQYSLPTDDATAFPSGYVDQYGPTGR